jgi:hypothetical protein
LLFYPQIAQMIQIFFRDEGLNVEC